MPQALLFNRGSKTIIRQHHFAGFLGDLGTFLPIATPTSARFNAGASLTPSSVIANTCPSACSAVTRRNLFSGLVAGKDIDVADGRLKLGKRPTQPPG
jgi:hypothetical protein